MFSMSLGRLNKFATLAILPGMVLVIMLFSNAAKPPKEPAPPPSEGVLVTANLRSASLSFHDFRTGRTSTLALPGAPHEMVELDGRLYITTGRADLVVEVDPGAPAVLRTLRIAGEPHGIAVHKGDLVVSLDDRDSVVTIDRATLTVTRSQPTGDTPHVVASTGEALFVTDTLADTARRIGDDVLVQPTGETPESLAVAGDYLVVANYGSGSLSFFDTASLGQVTTVAVGAGPVRVVSLDDERVAVSLQGTPGVAVVSVPNGEILERFESPDRPDGLCLSPGGGHLAVASNGTGTVSLFDTEAWDLSVAVTAGDGPGACLWLTGR